MASAPEVATHPVRTPRIAIMHTWQTTQTEGWIRVGFVEEGGLFVAIGNSASLPTHFGLAGNVSIRQTQDLWARGGVFRTQKADRSSPLGYGYGDELGVYFNTAPVFAQGGGGRRGFRGRGGAARGGDRADGDTTARNSGRGGDSVIQGRPRDLGEAGAEAFRSETQQPTGGGRGGGRGGGVPVSQRVRTVFRFPTDVNDLLISGGLMNGQQMTGAPALVNAPLGDGHVVLFSFNPFWRSQTLGSYALVFNALMHFDNLDAGRRVATATDEAQR